MSMHRLAFLGTMAAGFLAQAASLPVSAAPLDELIGESPTIARVRRTIRKLARPGGPRPSVVLAGETGSGKSLGADLLFRLGRPGRPLLSLNWAAPVPASKLFGLLQEASGGTLILQEVDMLDPAEQIRLLEELRPLSSTTWVISTIRNPHQATHTGWMRPDLYRVLSGAVIEMPPLRDRGDDACLLAERLIARYCRRYDLPAMDLTPDARAYLAKYPWPGNVLELSHQIERAVLLADDDRITAELLAPEGYVGPRAFPLDAAEPSSTTL
jgi:DNA-binding NtrC family response regulator